MLCVTVLSAITFNIPYFAILGISAPILFGLALIISNYHYCRYWFSGALCLIAFLLIFFYGTLPFYGLGNWISDNVAIAGSFGIFGGLLLSFTTVKILFNGIKINFLSIIMLLVFPVLANCILSLLLGKELFVMHHTDMMHNLSLTIGIFQFFLTLMIVGSLNSENESYNNRRNQIFL